MSARREFLEEVLKKQRIEKTKWLEDGLRIRKAIAETKQKLARCVDEERQAFFAIINHGNQKQ
jgi:hypothetical protein